MDPDIFSELMKYRLMRTTVFCNHSHVKPWFWSPTGPWGSNLEWSINSQNYVEIATAKLKSKPRNPKNCQARCKNDENR